MKLVGALLAAGASRRMGRAKQLLKLEDDVCLVRRAAQAMCNAALERSCVVVDAAATEIVTALAGLQVELVSSSAPSEGIAASIRAGVGWASQQGAEGLVLCVCDQPSLTSAHIDRLLEKFRSERAPTASLYSGKAGVPAVFPKDQFASLLALRGDVGAAKLLRDASRLVTVAWPEGELDLDTPRDVALWMERSAAG